MKAHVENDAFRCGACAMTKDGRLSRSRSKVTAGDADSPSRAAKAGPASTSDDVLASKIKRTHQRDRIRASANKLGLKPLPEKPSTKDLLMDVGEVVIGRQGVEGVTLRELALLAGQSNSNVVQYHFNNKDGLISAILEDRTCRLEQVRSKKFEDAKNDCEQNSPRKLIEILWLPTLSFQDEQGNHAFCRFMLQCRLHSEFSIRFPDNDQYNGSVIIEIMKLLRNIYPYLTDDVFNYRFSTLTLMFISSVVEFDNFRQTKENKLHFDPNPIIDMTLAALSAPHEK
jgi:AcrR family transcriptional regulator